MRIEEETARRERDKDPFLGDGPTSPYPSRPSRWLRPIQTTARYHTALHRKARARNLVQPPQTTRLAPAPPVIPARSHWLSNHAGTSPVHVSHFRVVRRSFYLFSHLDKVRVTTTYLRLTRFAQRKENINNHGLSGGKGKVG